MSVPPPPILRRCSGLSRSFLLRSFVAAGGSTLTTPARRPDGQLRRNGPRMSTTIHDPPGSPFPGETRLRKPGRLSPSVMSTGRSGADSCAWSGAAGGQAGGRGTVTCRGPWGAGLVLALSWPWAWWHRVLLWVWWSEGGLAGSERDGWVVVVDAADAPVAVWVEEVVG